MNKMKFFWIFTIYLKINIISILTYFISYLLIIVLNPGIHGIFKHILYEVQPDFKGLAFQDTLPFSKTYIIYSPENYIITKMLSKFPRSIVKGYANESSLDPISKNWVKSMKPDTNYVMYKIREVRTQEKVDIMDLSTTNMSMTTYHISNVSYESTIFHNYKTRIDLDSHKHSLYLTTIYVLMKSLLEQYSTSIPDIYFSGMPNSIYYENIWPACQLLFFYFLGGIFTLHFNNIRHLSARSPIPTKGLNAIINYTVGIIIFALIYSCVMIIVGFLLSHPLYSYRFIYSTKWYQVCEVLILGLFTVLFFAIMICEWNMETFNLMYFMAIIMAPKILYIFSFGEFSFNNCYFQHISSMSTLMVIGWGLTAIEDRESKTRFSIPQTSFKSDLHNKCYSLYAAMLYQVAHILFNIFFIFIINFIKGPVHRRLVVWKHQDSLTSEQAIGITTKRSVKKFNSSSDASSREASKVHKTSILNYQYAITLVKIFKVFNDSIFDKIALKNVSVRIKKHSITAIVGPNGSGKSTLLKIIQGEISPTSGKVFINGFDINLKPEIIEQEISKFSSDLRIVNFLTIEKYFDFIVCLQPVNYHEELKQLVYNLLTICQLYSIKHLLIKQCSYSVKKMVKILSVFISDKSIIILDDPFSGFDYRNQTNLCNVLYKMRLQRTIIITSSECSLVEYLCDSAIVLVNGRKVSHVDLDDFVIGGMSYKLVCTFDSPNKYFNLLRFMTKLYPGIQHDYTCENASFFSIPKILPKELWNFLRTLDKNCDKLKVARYKIIRLSLRHYLAYCFDAFLKKHQINSLVYSTSDVLPENIRESFQVYKNHFFLIIGQRLSYYYRYPMRLIMRFLIPIFVLFIWVFITSVTHSTIIYLDSGFIRSSYIDELNQNHTYYMGCYGTTEQCYTVFRSISSEARFIRKYIQTEYIVEDLAFYQFQMLFYQLSKHNYLKYNNDTLFGILVIYRNKTTPCGYIMANDYRNRIFATDILSNVLMYPKVITVLSLLRDQRTIKDNFVEVNYLFRLVIIILLAFTMTTYKFNASALNKNFHDIHMFAGVHYTLMHLPHFILDIFLYWLIICFMILSIYVMNDHDFTTIQCNTYGLISGFVLFALADSTFKDFLSIITNYNPTVTFGLKSLDLLIIIFSNSLYLSEFIITHKMFSYTIIDRPTKLYVYLDDVLTFILPIAALNYGIISMQKKLDTVNYSINGILFLQTMFYMAFLYTWQANKYGFSYWIKRRFRYFQKYKLLHLKELENKRKVFLFIKGVSLFKEKLYFENVNVEIKQSTIWGIVGPNQAGKTKLIKIILGQYLPNTGAIYLNGRLTKTFYSKQRGVKLGYSSEYLYGYPELSVEENMIYWAKIKLLPRNLMVSAIYDMINVLLMTNDLKTLVRDLSQSSAKKLTIALAFLGFPELIVLEDPFSLLDSLSRQGVLHLLTRAKVNGSATIITCTDLNDVRHMITNLIILDNGDVYQGKLTTAILSKRVGYYVTCFVDEEIYSLETIKNTYALKILELMLQHFPESIIYQIFEVHVTFFIPFYTLQDPNSTKIHLFFDSIKGIFHIKKYMLRYNTYRAAD